VSVFEPADVDAIEQLPAATVPTQLAVPSLTVTLPVGVPVPGALTVTVKLTVYGCPTTDGSGVSLVIVVVVFAAVIVPVRVAVALFGRLVQQLPPSRVFVAVSVTPPATESL
jgi:hypothetical protein